MSVSSASKRPLQRRTFKLKRSGPASANTKGVKEAAPLGSCGDSSSSKEPQTTSPVALTKVWYQQDFLGGGGGGADLRD